MFRYRFEVNKTVEIDRALYLDNGGHKESIISFILLLPGIPDLERHYD